MVLQSLVMLNGSFAMNRARLFAARVRSETPGGDQAARIDRAFRLSLSRPPSEEEQGLAIELLRRQAVELSGAKNTNGSTDRPLEHLCHMLLNTNEFLYVP